MANMRECRAAANEAPPEIVERTTVFAERVLKCCQSLCKLARVERPLLTQLLRAAASVGANLNEAQSAESRADFAHKVNIALKEARETSYWLRLVRAAKLVPPKRLDALLNEAGQIQRILRAINYSSRKGTKPSHSEFSTQNSELPSSVSA